MSRIKVISKETHQLLVESNSGKIILSDASVVVLKINKNDVKQIEKKGLNAVVTLKTGEKIIIENFFSDDVYHSENSLVFENDQKKLLWVQFTDANGAILDNITYSYINSIEPLLYKDAVAGPLGWSFIPVTIGGIFLWAGQRDKNSKDILPPEKPNKPAGFEDNEGGKQGIFLSDIETDDRSPGIVIGPVALGHKPILFVDGKEVPSNYDAGTGILTPVHPLTDGTSVLSYIIIDSAGNSSEASDSIEIVVDTIPPSKPETPTGFVDNVGDNQGDFSSKTETDDSTPSILIGVVPPGHQAILFVNGKEVSSTYDPIKGTLTPVNPLTDGNINLSYTIVDPVGNSSVTSDPIEMKVDTTPPTKPITPNGFVDNVGDKQGNFSSQTETDDSTPSIVVGPIASGDVLKLFVNGIETPSEYDANTNTLKPKNELQQGSQSLTYKIIDTVGNASVSSDPIEMIVDTTPPLKPDMPKGFVDNVGDKQGNFSSNTETDDSTPGMIIGVVESGHQPKLLVNGKEVPSTYDPVKGTLTPDNRLPDGTSNLSYIITDLAGNSSEQSDPIEMVVDTIALTKFAIITNVIDNVLPQTGVVVNNGSTNDNAPSVQGTINTVLGVGEKVIVVRDGVAIGEATVTETNWTFTDKNLVDGNAYSYSAYVQNTDSIVGGTSNAYKINIDTTAPVQTTTIAEIIDNTLPNLGNIINKGFTNDDTPELKGTINTELNNGEFVAIYRDNVKLGNAKVSGTDWNFSDEGLSSGSVYAYTARVEDTAGNQAAQSNKYVISVDTSVSNQVVQILSLLDDFAPQTGVVFNNASTNDKSPQLTGSISTALTGTEKVVVLRDGSVVGEAKVTGTSWIYQDSGLIDGSSYTYTARVDTAAGNQSPPSSTFTILVDLTAPTQTTTISKVVDNVEPVLGNIANGASTNDITPELQGTISAILNTGEVVAVYRNGVKVGNATVNNTSWKFTDSDLSDATTYMYTARVEDTAGNRGPLSNEYSLTANTFVPSQIVTINSYSDNVGIVVDNFTSGSTTDDRTPVLNGTLSAKLDAGQKIAIYQVNGSVTSLLGYANTVDTVWKYEINSNLKDGENYIYYARVEDQAGNVGFQSANFIINIDLIVNINTQNTLDTTPIISGYTGFNILKGEYLEVTVDNVTYSSKNGAVVIDPLHNTWYVQIPKPLVKGMSYDVVTELKAADNSIISRDNTSAELVIGSDPLAPNIPTTKDAAFKPTAVTLEQGAFQMYINGSVISQDATNITQMMQFNSNILKNTTTDSAGAATFIDFDRDGDMDIFAVDNEWLDGQQAFERKTFDTISNFETKGITGRSNTDWYGFQVGTTASGYGPRGDYIDTTRDSPFSGNVWVINGGIVALDKIGDGYVDMVVGDSFLSDGQFGMGVESSFVMNDRLQEQENAFFYKDNAYGSDADVISRNSAKIISELNGVRSNLNQDQLGTRVGTVDLDGNGTVDVIGSNGFTNSPTYQISGKDQTTLNDRSTLVVIDNKGNGELETKQILTDAFVASTANYNNSSITFADFDGDGDFDFFNAEKGFIKNNDGLLDAGTADKDSGVQAANVTVLANTETHRGSVAVDWNGDGKMDLITLSGAGTASKSVSYFVNTSTGTGLNFDVAQSWTDGNKTAKGVWSAGANKNVGVGFSGVVAADFDFDGDRDLMAFSTTSGSYFVENTDVNFSDANSGVIHLRILDQEGINALFGNTVRLFDAEGKLVSSQMINPQSGNQANDSTAIVSFYGLDRSKTYSAQILRDIGGNEAHVGVSNLGGKDINAINAAWNNGVTLPTSAGATPNKGIGGINAAWGELKTGNPWDAYVLTAENQTASFNANNGSGIVGTGYNDIFFATLGDDKFDGAGGTTIVSDERVWNPTGGQDIVDYKLSTSAITVDLSKTDAQSTGYGTQTFKNIEGIAGTSGHDSFKGNAANNYFEGRGGNDTYDLTSGGQDTLIYKLLESSNATGGNGSDTVTGFTVGTAEATPNADIINIKDLLFGYTAHADGAAKHINGVPTINVGDTIVNYINVTQNGNNTVISIDRDGAVGGTNYTPIITLNNVQTSLDMLLANNQIVIA